MLVDNKFYFLSIPRCASTSFHITCLKMGIDLKFADDKNSSIPNDLMLDNETMADNLIHGHEDIKSLEDRYGNHYDIIAVKRDRHERFVSLWRHIVDELYRIESINVAEIISKLPLTEIIPNEPSLVYSKDSIIKYTNDFFKKYNLGTPKYYEYMMFIIGLKPIYFLHNHDTRVIWFDINKLFELEEWVSKKIGREFKLEKINSSKHIETVYKIDDEFVNKYNKIYNQYDLHKKEKTLL